MTFSKETGLIWAASFAVIVLTFCTLLAGVREIQAADQLRDVRDSLRKLAALTIRNFPERNLESSELFWKSIGREGKPMMDPWGTPFQLSERNETGARVYYWTSAGRDRIFATHDDVVVEVPYPSGPFTAPEGESPPAGNSMDAK